MEEQQVRGTALGVGQRGTVKAVVAHAFRNAVVQGLGEQLAYAIHRVLPPGDRVAAVVEAAGHRLAGRIAVQAGHRRLGVTGQQGAFQQALGVDHQVVAGFSQAALEAAPLAALQRLPEVLAPAPDGHRNDLRHRRVPGRNFGEAFFHHPVKGDAGDGPRGVGQRRQRMNHVAQR
ncbi:hypothetical protein D9M71_418140 [compost metagenome]